MRELVELRDQVAGALGDAHKTIAAMDRLGAEFERTTGLDRTALKSDRKTGRALLYHDTAVDWGATLGGRSLSELSGPLELLLATCRYVTWKLAEHFDELARAVLAEGESEFEVVLDELALALSPDGSTEIAAKVMADTHAKMQTLLEHTKPHHSDDQHVVYRSQDLRERWLDAFTAPRHGWTAARFQSPDIMLATNGDQHTWVLGELHMAMNPLDYRFCLNAQQTPGQLEELIDNATTERYIPAFPDYWPRKTPRTYPPPAHYLPEKHRYWTLWSRTVVSDSVPKLSCVGLTVADRDGQVVVVDTDGQTLARFTDFIGELLSITYSSIFSFCAKGADQKRISIDNLVVQRRTWQIPAGALAHAGTGGGDLLELFDSFGIPKHTFVRVPGQPKPVFCETNSSLITHNLARLVRKLPDQGELVQVQEMIPEPEQLWLHNADGDPVTSEFRFIAQDLRE
jgi:hypothetical protein